MAFQFSRLFSVPVLLFLFKAIPVSSKTIKHKTGITQSSIVHNIAPSPPAPASVSPDERRAITLDIFGSRTCNPKHSQFVCNKFCCRPEYRDTQACKDLEIYCNIPVSLAASPYASVSPVPSTSPASSVSPAPSSSPSPSVTPTPSVSPSPSVSPKPSVTASPSVPPKISVSPSPSSSPSPSTVASASTALTRSPSTSSVPADSAVASPTAVPLPSASPSPGGTDELNIFVSPSCNPNHHQFVCNTFCCRPAFRDTPTCAFVQTYCNE